ncbi:F-box/LRR-repeat protein 20-like [Ptychodera flava]|uniref:F-box/LRR-repeat protein 20-like n=1 Tax=Ptychodera flava TaxID=63121 RepID=UPI00396A4FFE
MAVLSLHFLAKTVIVQILIDHNDKHTEYRERAQGIIRQLQTDHYASVSEDILETFTENYPSIVSDELLCVLAPPHLRKLQLFGFTNVKDIENIHQLFRKSSKIETLSLDGCDGLISIDLCYFLCKTLTHLNSVTMESCPPITDEHVQFLLMYCPSLTHLNIAWNEDITDDVFNLQSLLRRTSQSAADQEWTAPSLNSVDVSGCRFLTSNCIRHLAKLCGSKLQALNVSYTQGTTWRLPYSLPCLKTVRCWIEAGRRKD